MCCLSKYCINTTTLFEMFLLTEHIFLLLQYIFVLHVIYVTVRIHPKV
jgi:hypothetical protein